MAVFLFGRGKPPEPLNPIFLENSWEQIIKACQLDKVPDTWKIGDYKPMIIDGTIYQVDIIGINHDRYSDGTGNAPLTFQLHDCYSTTYGMNIGSTNAGGWEACEMRKTFLPAILALMPSEVQTGIREVSKLSGAGSQNNTMVTTSDKLFLLAEIEIVGGTAYGSGREGVQYAYYSAGNTRIKKVSSTARKWWNRSPSTSSPFQFGCIDTSGSAAADTVNLSNGVSFGFCF